MQKTIFKIIGMHCSSCAMAIDGALEDTGKIQEAKTSYIKQQTEVIFDSQKISDEEIIQIIKKIGYDAVVQPQE